ncbi:8-demethyl-8-aminoriboflavin-5'-phosphate (AFP) synthase RosB [Alteribacter lacisalsi]|uniref:8-demethyl-8-aminoriboflavin-5'-phosphate (AFP) synthase RosB n=1 Tax=Alteribacter lacisalsi TaxID=2045244 RepID=A0A2W0HT39_9BACI|nr:flavodoxin family protein [Alteribacter lacisalsi]PYZ96768.1 8-demethyl-8-aminoriboflavin-5'-phosphate (AFP) synthase RosB [Alteribacter lacisalsi]
MANLKCLMLNTSLKTSDEESNTSALMQEAARWMESEGVQAVELRVADYKVVPGMEPDMGDSDEWPQLMERVLAADILVIGTPIWMGEKSSIATRVMERLYASSSETNEKGQAIYYNKVAGVIVTGNEDGAKHASQSILYGMQHVGFTIPPNVDAYWVGEAGPGPSYMEAGRDSEFTKKNTKMLAFNLVHFARMLKENPIPEKGNS